jgi:hypothetical protein
MERGKWICIDFLIKILLKFFLPGHVCAGILAADESTGTMGKRLAGLGLENNEENR